MCEPNDIYTEEYQGYTIRIVRDDCDESPREWDNLGRMYCWHDRYKLGDEQPKESPEEWAESFAAQFVDSDKWERFVEKWESKYPQRFSAETNTMYDTRVREWADKRSSAIWDIIHENAVVLPLYLYDHSGITMNTSGFSCPWDSGQVGFILVDNEKIRKEYSVKRITKQLRAKIEGYLRNEVKAYDDYLQGNVYGYIVEKDGEDIDSCWGFIGDYDDKDYSALAEARSQVDYLVKGESE